MIVLNLESKDDGNHFIVTLDITNTELKKMVASSMTDLRWGEVSHGNSDG